MNIELKPCPFCGGEAVARVSPNSRSEEGASFYEVRCKKCGIYVTGKSFDFWVTKYNKEKPQDLLSAVEAWNKRAYEEERKTGKWVAVGCMEICSECGASRENQLWDEYCGRCGAKMEAEKGVNE